MTVIAYTSAAASPKVSQVDKTYDLASVSLPVASLQLYGDAEDSTDPTPTWTWQWSILDKPVGAATTFVDDTVQNPVLQDLDVWGNTLVALVATNTNNAAVSESNPLLMPNTARVTVRMLGAKSGVEKSAAGERDWYTRYRAAVQVIEDLKNASVGAHTILSHTDVSTATGPDIDRLSNGSYAHQGGNPANPGMHKHTGAHVDVATDVVRGVAYLEDAAADPANPKIITRERIIYQGTFAGTLTASGFTPGQVFTPAGGNNPPWHVIWYVDDDVEIESFQVVMADGGPITAVGDDPYIFQLHTASEANVEANSWAVVNNGSADAEVSGTCPTSHGPLVLDSAAGGQTWSVTGRQYLSLQCVGHPVDVGAVGSVIIQARRQV